MNSQNYYLLNFSKIMAYRKSFKRGRGRGGRGRGKSMRTYKMSRGGVRL